MRRLRAEAQMACIVTGAQVAAAVLILAVLVFFGASRSSAPARDLDGGVVRRPQRHALVAAVALIFSGGFGLSRLLFQENT